jgi:ABC-type glycerol-3-phosphate transport system substrate-binding protein
MKTLPSLLAASIASAVLAVGSTDAFTQDASAQEFWSRTPCCVAAPVRDAPFSAEAVTTWHPSAKSGRTETLQAALPQRFLVEWIAHERDEASHRQVIDASDAT